MQPEPIEFINFAALRQHLANYDSLFHKLLELFVEQAPLWINELNEAVAGQDFLQLRQICHKIKGSAGTLQAQLIIEAAADLNIHAVASDLANTETSRARLISAINGTIAFIRASGHIKPQC